jgi:hypothetical protein
MLFRVRNRFMNFIETGGHTKMYMTLKYKYIFNRSMCSFR